MDVPPADDFDALPRVSQIIRTASDQRLASWAAALVRGLVAPVPHDTDERGRVAERSARAYATQHLDDIRAEQRRRAELPAVPAPTRLAERKRA